MPDSDLNRRETLRLRDGDVRRAANVEHGTPNVARGAANSDQRQSGERKSQVAEPVEQLAPAGEEIGIEASGAEPGQGPEPVGEDHHQHQSEPVAWEGKEGDRQHREGGVEPASPRRLNGAYGNA